MEKNKIILNISESLKDELDFFLRYNNLSREKINLFHDFLISLDGIINDTYLGPDVLNEYDDIKGHYKWCWKKVIDGFNKERIFFILVLSLRILINKSLKLIFSFFFFKSSRKFV